MNYLYRRLFVIAFLMLFDTFVYAQFDYSESIEKWSAPVKVDDFSGRYSWDSEICLTRDMDTAYYFVDSAIYRSVLKNGVWQAPEILNDYVNGGAALKAPTLSKDGKRLYYSSYGGYGSWDLWYHDWDENAKDWGPARNMGPGINTAAGEYYLYELSKDTVYIITDRFALQSVCMFKWIEDDESWKLVDSFYSHHLGMGSITALSITEDRKKLYFSRYMWGQDSLQTELGVCYWDIGAKTWGDPKFLNINSAGYKITINQSTGYGSWYGAWDEYPWISPDGKTLYFDSNRDSGRRDTTQHPDIYVSHLIIDENGDPVIGTADEKENMIPEELALYPNYPNPFNPATTISYNLPKAGKVKLLIYDSLGRLVKELVDKEETAGLHKAVFNARGLSSGIYFYMLLTENNSLTRKLMIIK